MPRIPLRIQSYRPKAGWWPDDETLGTDLVALVRAALEQGRAGTMGLVVRRDQVQLVPLKPLADARLSIPLVLAGLARWDEGEGPPEAVGLIGRLRMRRRGQAWVPMAMVFLEWPDGRWWEWRTLLDPQGAAVTETDGIARAVDGLPRPQGLGGWWTLARRRKPTLRLERNVPPVASDVVQ